ncbi:O-antigen ligase family protein [Streptomyces sp. ACA25]|uniref:O-antigen ligase family protein n=1 Tax=Streptomyces sp. ACA25 TaxID=3022596 RepID=UPI002307E667|nr:O-antigen ligase family protein [Streptomyces sp. ACA25]MDB1086298.1 O-antigen ligase family protein [Streptomyces sp. ACA25]
MAWPVLPVVATVLLLCLPGDRGPAVGAAGGLSAADMASAVLVVVCAVWLLRGRRQPLSGTAAVVPAALAVALAVVTVASHDPVASLSGFLRFLQLFVLVPLAVLVALRGHRDFRLVAVSVVLLAAVQGAVGTHQYVTGTGASYMGQDIRAVGTFGPLDVMGMATAVSYGLIIALGLALAPPATAPRWWRPAALGCAALLLVPLCVSFSRGAWIATAVAATAVLLLAGLRQAVRTLVLVVCAGVVLVGGAGIGSGMIAERLSSITQVTGTPDQSVTDRYAMWAAALSMWRDEPWTGVGPRGFAAHRDGHASVALSSASDIAGAGRAFTREPLLSPHNMYLLVLSEQGLAGATALAGAWVALMLGALRRLADRRRAGEALDTGLIAAGLLIWQTVNFLYSDIGGSSAVLTAVMFGLIAWWALAPASLGRSGPRPAAAPPVPVSRSGSGSGGRVPVQAARPGEANGGAR